MPLRRMTTSPTLLQIIDALREYDDPPARLIVARWDNGRRTGIGQEALSAPEIQRLKEIVAQLQLDGDRPAKRVKADQRD
jgi:hypothetical protein